MRTTKSVNKVVLFINISILVIGGCRTLPDTSSFSELSNTLATAVYTVGQLTESEMRITAISIPDISEELSIQADKFSEAWKQYVKAMNAAAEYTHSIQDVVDAGMSGRENATHLLGSAKQLANSAGFIGSGAVDSAIEIISAIYGQIARGWARKSLLEVMHEIEPHVNAIVKSLSSALREEKEIIIDSTQMRLNELRIKHATGIIFRKNLVRLRNIHYEIGWNNLDPKQRRELKAIGTELDRSDSWYLPYLAQKLEILKSREDAINVIDSLADGISKWANTHTSLIISLEQGCGIDTTELLITIDSIIATIQRIQK